MENINGISIVVATKGRVALLEELLIGVEKARKNYNKPSEVILVDDSNAKDQELIEKICNKYDAHLEKYSNTVSMKRNHGVEVSKYNLILFLDSDCNPVEEILGLHDACYTEERAGAAAGPLEFVGDENRFWKCVTSTPYLICFKMPYWGKNVPWGATANFSIRKDVFEEIGGFSQAFPNKPGGEDVDLGLMITEAGYEIISAPKAVVYHAKETWSKVIPMFKRAWHYGAADYYLVDRHKKLVCDAIPRRTVLAGLMILLFMILGVAKTPLFLLGIPAWCLLDIVVMAAIMSQIGFEKTPVHRQCVVQTLIIWNELGYICNCIRHKKLNYINKQIIYFDNQLKGNTTNGHVTFWRFIIGYVLIIGSFLLI